MLKVTINDKKYDYPESFDDISMKQYCRCFYKLLDTNKNMSDDEIRIITLENEATIISRLLNEDDGFVASLPLQVFARLKENTLWLYDIADYLKNNEFFLSLDGKKYFVPNPEEMSLRQYIDADVTMKEEENKDQFIELLAILLRPFGKDEKYDGDYKELIPKIERMPASKCLPFIYTFFKKKGISKKLMEDFSKVQEGADQLLQSIPNS